MLRLVRKLVRKKFLWGDGCNKSNPYELFVEPNPSEGVFWTISRLDLKVSVFRLILTQNWSRGSYMVFFWISVKNLKFRSALTFALFNIFLIGQNWVKATIFLFPLLLSDYCYNEIEFWCYYPYVWHEEQLWNGSAWQCRWSVSSSPVSVVSWPSFAFSISEISLCR